MNDYLVISRHVNERTSKGEIVEKNLTKATAIKMARVLNEDRWNVWQYWAVSEKNYNQPYSDEETQS